VNSHLKTLKRAVAEFLPQIGVAPKWAEVTILPPSNVNFTRQISAGDGLYDYIYLKIKWGVALPVMCGLRLGGRSM